MTQQTAISSDQFIYEAVCEAAEKNGLSDNVAAAKAFINAVTNAKRPELTRNDTRGPNGALPSSMIQPFTEQFNTLKANHFDTMDWSTSPAAQALADTTEKYANKIYYDVAPSKLAA